MFFDLCFPSIEPWSDLDELLAAAEQADGGREPTPAGCAEPPPCPPARCDASGAPTNAK
jgi:hypothetical protein